jgi:hypothetical protein
MDGVWRSRGQIPTGLWFPVDLLGMLSALFAALGADECFYLDL